MIDQISVFLENSAGVLADVTGVLAENDVDIRALNIAETSDYGVLRVITDDSLKTMTVLGDNGFISSCNKVVCISVDDRPGALSRVLRILSDSSMDVEYMYSIFSRLEGRAFMIIRVSDPEAAEKILFENGIHVADGNELDVK